MAATKWRDTSSGKHVDYDQRPDMFRYVITLECEWSRNAFPHVVLISLYMLILTEEQFDMQVSMPTLVEQPAEEMT